MQQNCSKCGKTFETDANAGDAICPACGKKNLVGTPAQSRSMVKDVIIILLVLALLALLTLLFLKPKQPVRDLVFGDLGPATNYPVTNPPVQTNPVPVDSPVVVTNRIETNSISEVVPTNGVVVNRPIINNEAPAPIVTNSSSEITNQAPTFSPSTPPIVHAPSTTAPLRPTLPETPSTASPISAASLVGTDSTTPESPSGRTADLLAASKDSTAPAEKSPVKTADILAVNTSPAVPPPAGSVSTISANSAPNPVPSAALDTGIGIGLRNDAPTSLFNSTAPASNVVFILDHSWSMKSHGKSTAVRQEVVNKLKTMNSTQKFYVLFFHSGGYVGMPTPGPVEVTPENIQAMTNWLFSVGHKLGSDPTKAVERALSLVPPPDTLWLLSDGKIPGKAVAAIRDANDTINAHVNTICFYGRSGEQVMRQIAADNAGVYKFIPPPSAASVIAADGATP